MKAIAKLARTEKSRSKVTFSPPTLIATSVGILLCAFVIAATPALALPDERAYELVSTLGSGEPYYPATPIVTPQLTAPGFPTSLAFRAAEDGEAVSYVGEPSATTGTGEIGPGKGNQWLASRTAASWQTEDITPPENSGAAFESFSTDLGTSFYEGDGKPLTSEVEKECVALYTRTGGSFKALFEAGEMPGDCGHPLFSGASSDESHIIFQSEAALTPGAEAAEHPANRGEHDTNPSLGQGCMFGCNLYDAVGGNLQLVNEMEGKQVPSAVFGGYPVGETEMPELTDFSRAISRDGSRIFWTATAGPDIGRVYVRENGSTTVQVSGAGPAEYWISSSDGRYAFYTEGGALLRFDLDAYNEAFEEKHESVTEAKAAATSVLVEASEQVQGVIGASEDGAYVYVVANGVLTAAPNSHGESAETKGTGDCPAPEFPGHFCHLYLLHESEPKEYEPTYIATLSGVDDRIEASHGNFNDNGGDWQTGLGERLAQVTPDGRSLVFESIEEIAGYERVGSGTPDPGVFVYRAEGNELSCASCSAEGPSDAVSEEGHSKLPVSQNASTYMRRWISNNGSRVFFDSSQELVPQAKSGIQNVYEWEHAAQPGEEHNTCASREASIVTGGCTFLLSGGSEYDSFLIDADAEGDNVFFEHVGPLGQVDVPVGNNELYDVRVDGGFAQASLACTGTGCQGVPPAPPIFATPSSVTFTGAGNPLAPHLSKTVVKSLTRAQRLAKALKACAKDRNKRKRATCDAQAKRKYGAKSKPKQKKAGNRRGAKS